MITVDFYNRIFLKRLRPDESLNERQERFQVRVSRLINCFTGPLLGVFLLGMFTRRAGSLGTFIGAAAGTAVSLCLVHQSNLGRISFLWPSTFGLLTTLILGYALSCLFGGRPDARAKWCFREVVSRSEEEIP